MVLGILLPWGICMSAEMEKLYQQRLARYVKAMRNEKPDRIPIRPFVAEFTAKYAGYTIQEVTQDYRKAFAAARKCAAEFDWDAVVGNMVYGWSGLTQAIGLKYYAVPGVDLPIDTGFQYIEPPEDAAWMRPDEYDLLAADVTGYLFNVWLPRASADVRPTGQARHVSPQHVVLEGRHGDDELLRRFRAAHGGVAERVGIGRGDLRHPQGAVRHPGRQAAGLQGPVHGPVPAAEESARRLRSAGPALAESRLDGRRSGQERADRVVDAPRLRAVHFARPVREVLLADVASGSPRSFGPGAIRRCIMPKASGTRTSSGLPGCPSGASCFTSIAATLPRYTARWARNFCLSGGIPNDLLAFGSPDDIRACCKKVIDTVARDGGYVMDASAIMQDDTKAENLRAMTDFTREYGVY